VASDFSYSGAPAADDPVGLVRLLVGDTRSDDPLLTDSEIEAILGFQSVITYAAASCADIIAAKFARDVDTAIGETRISLSQKVKAYQALADRLRLTSGDIPGGDGTGIANLGMFVGGISQSEKEAFLDDSNRIQPNFSLGMDDNPGVYSNNDDLDDRD
jgi:hypothetical protein